MVEYPTLLPTRRQICDALTAVVREEKVLRALLKLSVLQEEKRRRTEEMNRELAARLRAVSSSKTLEAGGSSDG